MRISDWSSDVCSSDLGSGGSAEILVEGFATDPQVTGDDGLALAVINTAVQLGDHFVGEGTFRSEEHTSELQSLMRISYAVFCLKNKNTQNTTFYEIYVNIHTNRVRKSKK